ncbi:MAG: hypothetical protein Q9227_002253 [Pyrenula ochraceoflavens]
MAEPPTLPRAPFPAPPPFWQQFTLANTKKLDAAKKAQAPSSDPKLKPYGWPPSELLALTLPPELRYLVPPPPPTQPTYRVFDANIELTPSLPPIPPLPTSRPLPSNPQTLLTLLTKYLLLNFAELTSLLATDPASATEKAEDIELLYKHVHRIINQYRPHQARENVIAMMEEQLQRGRGEIEESEKVIGKIGNLLKELGGQGQDGQKANGRSNMVTVKVDSPADETLPENISDRKDNEDVQWLWSVVNEIGSRDEKEMG